MPWRTVPFRLLLLILPTPALNLARWLSRPAQSAVWPNVCDKGSLSPAGQDAEIERFAQNGVHFTKRKLPEPPWRENQKDIKGHARNAFAGWDQSYGLTPQEQSIVCSKTILLAQIPRVGSTVSSNPWLAIRLEAVRIRQIRKSR